MVSQISFFSLIANLYSLPLPS